MSFDFVSYLSRIDPTQSYTIQRLTGGVVNVTARASRVSDSNAAVGRFPSHPTFILKHALPYVAGVGPEAPFSTFRQTIEARALSLFRPSTNSLHYICEQSGVRVPVLLHHDQEQHVLIISDLGLLPNLSEIFGNLLSMPLGHKVPANLAAPPEQVLPSISPAEGFMIGQKAGSFLAGLHQPENVTMINSAPYNDPCFLEQDGVLDVIFHVAIKPVKEQLTLFPQLFASSTAMIVYRCLEENFTRKLEEDEKVIALGDCWTGALLVDRKNLPAEPQVGIIDWEFASIGRGVNGDMAQLLAHLCLFEIAATWLGDENSRAAVAAIMQGLTIEYRRRCQALNPFYIEQSATLAPEPHSMSARILRSAFLAHGAEIINNAFWKEWACDSNLCCRKGHQRKQDCQLVQKMVKRGWWYLYHAQEDEVGFVNRQNWDRIRNERILFSMFYDRCDEGQSGDSL